MAKRCPTSARRLLLLGSLLPALLLLGFSSRAVAHIGIGRLGWPPPAYGAWCETVDDCPPLDHMECRGGVCRCGFTYLYKGGACVHYALWSMGLGQRCDSDDYCSSWDSHLGCRDGVCACAQGYVLSNGTCVEWDEDSGERDPQPGDLCEETEDCNASDALMECRYGECACLEGHHLVAGVCKEMFLSTSVGPRTPQPEDWCEETGDCQEDGEDGGAGEGGGRLVCDDNVCGCGPDRAFVDGRCEELSASLPPPPPSTSPPPPPPLPSPPPSSHFGGWCMLDSECSGADSGLECFGGICLCKRGFVPVDGRCTANADFADRLSSSQSPPSETTVPPSIPATSPSTPPTMPPTFATLPPTAATLPPTPATSPPTSPALPTTPATLPTIPATLPPTPATTPPTLPTTPVTLPPTPATPPPTRTSLPPTPTRPSRRPELGESCAHSAECALRDENMECFGGVCLCRRGYAPRDGLCKKEILVRGDGSGVWEKARPAGIGALCEETSDCPPDGHVECRRGFCRCVKGYAEDAGVCKRTAVLGALCDASTDICFLEEDNGEVTMQCTHGKCVCKPDFVVHNERCKKQITLGSSCSHDRHCTRVPKASCSSAGRCECRDGHGPMNSTACGKRVGDPCDDGCDALNSQCLSKNRRDGNSLKVCSCKKYYMASSNKTYCYHAPQQIGDLCDLSHCAFLGENVHCVDGRCQCEDGYVLHDGLCTEATDY